MASLWTSRTWKFVLAGATAVAAVCLGVLALLATDPEVPKDDPGGGYVAGLGEGTSGIEVPISATMVAPGMPTNAAWWRYEDVGAVPRSLIPPRPEEQAGAVLVELLESLGEWREGDTVVVSVPQTGELLRPVIERVETLIGTSHTFTARTDDDPPVSVVITVAPQSTFAWISTSSGAFELTGNERFAWIGRAGGLREHFAEGRPDVMVLEEYP